MEALLTNITKKMGLVIFAGLLFLLALPPIGYAGLVLLCFVPLIYVIQTSSSIQSVFYGFLFGVVAYICIPLSLLPWGWDITVYALLITGSFFALLALLTKGFSLVPLLASAWVAFPLAYALLQWLGEFVLSVPVLLAVTYPVDWLDGRGMFQLIGGRGVDYIICCVNALFAGLLIERKARLMGGALAGLVVIVSILHIPTPGDDNQTEKTLEIITVDNNMSYQRVSQLPYSIAEKEAMTSELDLMTLDAVAREPDLIVWPEGGNGLANSQIPSRRAAFKAMANEKPYRLIAGSKYFAGDGSEYNVAEYIVDGDFVGRAEKQHRVPLLETALDSGDNGLFDVAGANVGVGICFDIAFSASVSDLVERGAQALLILSNDASFGYSALTYMHIRYSAIRALENSREVLFLSNTGPSIVIADNGRIKSGYVHSGEVRLESHKLQLQLGTTPYFENRLLMTLMVLAAVMLYLTAVQRAMQRAMQRAIQRPHRR